MMNNLTNEDEVDIKYEPLEPDVVDVSLCYRVSVSIIEMMLSNIFYSSGEEQRNMLFLI